MTTRHLINALWAAAAAVPFTLAGTAIAQPDADVGGIEFLELRVGQQATGELTGEDFTTPDGSKWDIYLVELTAGENYQFSASGQGFSAGVMVFTQEGAPVENCLYEADENSFTIQVPQSGTYSVAVVANDGQSTGRYTLTSRSGVAEPTQRQGEGGNANSGNNPGNGDNASQPANMQQSQGELADNDADTDDGRLYDYVSHELEAGKTYFFAVVGNGFTPTLSVQDDRGNVVEHAMEQGQDTTAVIAITPQTSGTHHVFILASAAGQSGRYTFTSWEGDLEAAAEQEPENNNNGPRPNNPNNGPRPDNNNERSTQQTFMDALDADDIALEDGSYFGYHFLELTAGVTYTITVTADDFDTQAYLFDAENNQLAMNDDGPDMGTNSSFTFTPETTGEYSVGVSSVKARQAGDYQVDVTSGPAVDWGDMEDEEEIEPRRNTPEVEEDHNVAQAPAVIFAAQGAADANTPAVSDVFHLEAGQTIVIETIDLSEGCDTIAQLYSCATPGRMGNNDTLLAENDDDDGYLSSRLVFTAPEAGDYYVNVTVYEGAAGTFTLEVRNPYPARESIVSQGVEIPAGEYVTIGNFELEASDQWVRFETLDLSENCDTVIELRRMLDPNQASDDDPVIAVNDDFFSRDHLLSRIYFRCDQPGHYYVVIHNIGNSNGTCTFRVQFEQ